MRKAIAVFILFTVLNGFTETTNHFIIDAHSPVTDTIPVSLPANFTDDYGIRYTVSDTLFLQLPAARYHILKWNLKEEYIIARNGAGNPSDGGLYTRIDYMKFKNMDPFLWGFCLSTYKAASDSLAEFSPTKPDRLNPRKGCNGYPFSRMKKIE